MDLIKKIQSEMIGWGFNFSTSYLLKWFEENGKPELFDTVERGELLQYMAKKETGMHYPCNVDSEEYKKEFWSKFDNRHQ